MVNNYLCYSRGDNSYLIAHIVGVTVQEIFQGVDLLLGVRRQIDSFIFVQILEPRIAGYLRRCLSLVVSSEGRDLRRPAYQFTPYIVKYLPVRQQLDVSVSLIAGRSIRQIYRHPQQIGGGCHLIKYKRSPLESRAVAQERYDETIRGRYRERGFMRATFCTFEIRIK